MVPRGSDQWKDETPSFLVLMNSINTLTHFMLGAIMFAAFSYAAAVQGIGSIVTLSTSFSQHIYLCVIGYVILMSQAMLVYNPYVGWATNIGYPQKRIIHLMMQALGSLLAIIGTIIKMSDNAPTLDSAHGVLGFIAMLIAILSLIGAVLSLIFSEQTEQKSIYHTSLTCLEALTMFFALVSLAVAFGKYKIVLNDVASDMAAAFTVFALLGLLILVFMNFIRKYLKF